jgi:phosphoribosyl-AMP cyclohydrolase
MTQADVLSRIDFEKGTGLVPVVVQDWSTRAVLMLGYANREAVERTLTTGRLHFWSRSRQELWLKGKKSGNYLQVRRLALDCDGDALLAEVEPATGETPVCHTGAETCFFTTLAGPGAACAGSDGDWGSKSSEE